MYFNCIFYILYEFYNLQQFTYILTQITHLFPDCRNQEPDAVQVQLSPLEDEHIIARNIQRNTIDLIKKLCIKLENKITYY